MLICAPVISQYAAVGALEAGRHYCEEQLAGITEVRAQVLASLAALGPVCTLPLSEGAFYFLLRLATNLDPLALVERLIRRHQVAVIPGTAFGLQEGCYLRLAYGSLSPQSASSALERFVRGVETILKAENQRKV